MSAPALTPDTAPARRPGDRPDATRPAPATRPPGCRGCLLDGTRVTARDSECPAHGVTAGGWATPDRHRLDDARDLAERNRAAWAEYLGAHYVADPTPTWK